MGWYARKHSLAANHVTAIEVVTPDGQIRWAGHEHEAELFWALRGGGGNFGVVTAIEFELLPLETVYAGALFFPFERAGEVLHMDPRDPVPADSTHAMLGELDSAAIDRWVEASGPGSGSTLISTEIRHAGGALSRTAPGAGAVATLPGELAFFAVGIAVPELVAKTKPTSTGSRPPCTPTRPATTPTSSRRRPTRRASSRPPSRRAWKRPATPTTPSA
jgi:FAD/FMN-containing dehydrogenase